jgi:hypothetical protein
MEFFAPGFASVIARSVIDVADSLEVELPKEFGEAYGHDLWTIFVAGALGKFVLLPDVLAYYRQHGNNVFGELSSPNQISRIRAAAAQSPGGFASELESEINKCALRCALLGQLADRCDSDGPIQRNRLWRHRKEATLRRLDLYRRRPLSFGAAIQLLQNIGHADYRSRARGGLGMQSLLKDMGRVGGAWKYR